MTSRSKETSWDVYTAQARTARPQARGRLWREKGAQDREGRFTMWALTGRGSIWKLTQTGSKAGGAWENKEFVAWATDSRPGRATVETRSTDKDHPHLNSDGREMTDVFLSGPSIWYPAVAKSGCSTSWSCRNQLSLQGKRFLSSRADGFLQGSFYYPLTRFLVDFPISECHVGTLPFQAFTLSHSSLSKQTKHLYPFKLLQK